MEHARLTGCPEGVEAHPVYDLLAGGADYLSAAELANANVRGGTPALLVHVEGEADAFAAALDAVPAVVEYEAVPASSGRSARLRARRGGAAVARAVRDEARGRRGRTMHTDASAADAVVADAFDGYRESLFDLLRLPTVSATGEGMDGGAAVASIPGTRLAGWPTL